MLNNADGGSNLSLLKDKTGLGLGWGRTPRDGRGPKTLRSVWRDWAEAEEFRTKFEVLTADEVERRDMERDRATRFVIFHIPSVLCDLWLTLDSDDYGEKHRSSRPKPGVGGSVNQYNRWHTYIPSAPLYYKQCENPSQREVEVL